MNLRLSCALVALLLLALDVVVHADDAANKKQLARFDGVWKIDKLHINGNDLPPNNIQNLSIRFKDGTMFIDTTDNGETKSTSKLALTIDPGFDPGLFDVRPENQDKTLEGIYKFEGEQLKICVNPTGQSRPTEISSADGANIVLILSLKK